MRIKKILTFIVCLMLATTSISSATYLPQGPSITLGGRVFPDVNDPNLIKLWAFVGTPGSWTSFRQGNDTAGYQVPVGKTLRIEIIRATANLASAQAGLLYGDTDVGVDVASYPTNPIYYGGITPSGNASVLQTYLGVPGEVSAAVYFDVPAGKYPHLGGFGGAVSVYAYGYLF